MLTEMKCNPAKLIPIMKTRIASLSLLGAMAVPMLYAQSDTGRITGTITDATSAVVPHATVTIKNEKTGQTRKVTANDQGGYLIPQLGPSTYTVTTEVT